MNATPDHVSASTKAKRRRVAGRGAAAFGVSFLLLLIVLAIAFPEPTPFQYDVFRIVLALAAAGVATMIPGFLEVEVSNLVKAGGALAVFVIVFFFSPAQLAVEQVPKRVGFIASSDEAFAVKGRFEGEAAVSGKEIRVKVEEGSISFPVRAPDGGDRYIEYISAGLACGSNDAWREVSRSQALSIDKPLGLGQVEKLEQFELVIPRSERDVGGCWLVFDIAVKNSPEDQMAGFSYAHTDRGLF